MAALTLGACCGIWPTGEAVKQGWSTQHTHTDHGPTSVGEDWEVARQVSMSRYVRSLGSSEDAVWLCVSYPCSGSP
jgi:hypothetical protein